MSEVRWGVYRDCDWTGDEVASCFLQRQMSVTPANLSTTTASAFPYDIMGHLVVKSQVGKVGHQRLHRADDVGLTATPDN
jgi:hypothetical protein